MNSLRVLVLLGLATVAFGGPSPSSEHCTGPGKLSVIVHEASIRDLVRGIAEHARLNIAIDPRLEGSVSLDLKCADVRTVLKLAAGQVGATFCETGNTVYISHRHRTPCRTPEPVIERVARRDRDEAMR